MSVRDVCASLLVVVAVATVAGGEDGAMASLSQTKFEAVRITLNPWGPHLGFALDIVGDEPRLAALVGVISTAEPTTRHKCANRGAIRFELRDGRKIAVGLLPNHERDFYDLRMYDDGRLEGIYRVRRDALLTALGELGVPVDDPALSD